MPEKAYMFGMPYEVYEKYAVRKYGFHGTSHRFVTMKYALETGKDLKDLKIVSCHLGNGSSITAVDGGKSVDTSMGLTPLEGLIMGTRCGDIDPSVVEFIANKDNLDIAGAMNVLNKKSGVDGISGVSSDFRDLWAAADNGNEKAKLALDMFCYRVAKYVGSYVAAMNGVDDIVFTAGIGENDAGVREKVLENLTYLGITVDKAKNDATHGDEAKISTDDSKVAVYVIPTNEELAIARETVALI
jgi:acetate kinase